MKLCLLLFAFILLSSYCSYGQGENNICAYGFESNNGINFNPGTPGVTTLPYVPYNQSGWASVVCDPGGQLRFFVRLKYNFSGAPEFYVFDHLGVPIAGSDLMTDAGMLDNSMPVVIPRPGNPDQYYIFHSLDYGLFYSLLDMSLNSGAGAIVSTEKNIQIADFGSIYTRLISPVKACDGAWLVIRSQIANEYYSYHITTAGIDTHKVISPVGNFPEPDYNTYGSLKASPDGTMLATTNWAGVELYRFEQCSGTLKNAVVIESSGNPPIFPGAGTVLPTYSYFTGVGFSPDNGKLYITKNSHTNFMVDPGELYQFDLNQASMAAVIASRTLILTNYPSLFENINWACDLVVQNPLGEIKRGPDGKMYVDNGSYTCLDTASVPAGFNPGPAFHSIDLPNLAGSACSPFRNRIKTPVTYPFFVSGDGGVSLLQNEIITPGISPDTVTGPNIVVSACFVDSIEIQGDTSGQCLKWDDGSSAYKRMVYFPGKYYARYVKGCSFTTDTFLVSFTDLPTIHLISNSCEGKPSGRIAVASDSNFRTFWVGPNSDTIKVSDNFNVDTVSGLKQGTYTVSILTATGCDTVLTETVGQYPAPIIIVSPADTMIRYGDSIQLFASGALFYTWTPSGLLDSAISATPFARPLEPTNFYVLGIDVNGCTDTGMVRIGIDYTMPDFVPNAFSPNGDGLNDEFIISNLTYQKIKQFRVFNRYGQSVFSTTDPKKGWNGTFNNKPCDPGTYFYLIQLEYPDRREKTYKGDVLLIR